MKSLKTDDLESFEEERRLLYVAITRAKKNLVLMAPRNLIMYGQSSSSELSRYINTPQVKNCILM